MCNRVPSGSGGTRILMRPIGVIHNDLVPHKAVPRSRSAESAITIHPDYVKGLQGIEACECLQVLFLFDRAPEEVPLCQHPMGDGSQPPKGVFALRSPHRPNRIGLTTVGLLRIEEDTLVVTGLDAWDGSPVLDIKPYAVSGDDQSNGS